MWVLLVFFSGGVYSLDWFIWFFFLTPYIFKIQTFAGSTFLSYGELSVLFLNPPSLVFSKNRAKNVLVTVGDLENYVLLIFHCSSY